MSLIWAGVVQYISHCELCYTLFQCRIIHIHSKPTLGCLIQITDEFFRLACASLPRFSFDRWTNAPLCSAENPIITLPQPEPAQIDRVVEQADHALAELHRHLEPYLAACSARVCLKTIFIVDV